MSSEVSVLTYWLQRPQLPNYQFKEVLFASHTKGTEYRDHPNYHHNPPDFKKILNKYMQVFENKINC